MKRRALIVGGALALATRRDARAGDAHDALARVTTARASLKTLVGPFTQARKIGLLATEIKSSGMMWLVRPDRLRWELAPPDEIVYWVAPEGLAYKSKSGQGRVGGAPAKIAAALEDLRAVLGGDLTSLEKRYAIKLARDDAEGVAFEATPRAPRAGLARIDFAIAKDLVTPTRALLVESPRDRTEIVFGALRRDVAVDPGKMRPPPA
jgi:outer membrane lipoprotein-sorting protein